MRKLLNTVYVTDELAYLSLDGENLVCKVEDKIKLRIPFDNIENIVCFNYLGCSPKLMGKCVEKVIALNFVSPSGRFLAKVCGETKGNVFLRVSQIECFKRNNLLLTQNTIAAKLSNTKQLIKRTLHDNESLRADEDILKTLDQLTKGIDSLYKANSVESILGIEGSCAKSYFEIFNKLFTSTSDDFKFVQREKRPPLDPINATLSFLYTMLTLDYASALETVGLDSYIGYYHTLRSGRVSLACDLVEETRCIIERLVITLFNLKILNINDFEKQISGAVWLNDDGRKKVITKWQEKKRSDFMHPYIKEKIPFGLLPYVQCSLLAKYIRGDIEEYPSLLVSQ
ncbi:MAG: type I-C CRISPR-associated endonuclease Cas1c [Bdellovibrionota bacterium]